MPKRSQVQLAAILAVAVSCWSQRVPVVPSTVEEISDSNGSQVAAPEAVAAAAAWGREVNDRREGSVCQRSVISAAEFLNAIKRLLSTEDAPPATISTTNRSIKKPTQKSRTKLSRPSFTPNDVTKARQQLHQHNAPTSPDDAPMMGMKPPGSTRDRVGKGTAPAAFQVVGPFTEKDLRMILRETARRRKGNRATTGGVGDNSNVMKSAQRQPANAPPFGDNLRHLSTPPIKDISLVVSDGRRAVHSEPIVFAPGMNVNSALTQAAILFDSDDTTDVNPFECDVTRSRSLLCYVIKKCAGNIADQWHQWNIEVKNTRGEVVSRGVCMPSSPLMPGYSVDILYVNTQSV